jgi:transcriptional antiterminator RfaH
MPAAKLTWYAVYTHSKAEKKVAAELAKNGIDHYLPLQMTIRQWSDRKKKVLMPLIKSYIFVHITPKEHISVVKVWGVMKIIHFGGKPVSIPDWQIRNLKILLDAEVPIGRDYDEFETGNEVHITQGSLKGLRGKILHVKGQHKLVISIDALNYNLTVDIDPRFVDPVAGNPVGEFPSGLKD